MSRWIGCLTGMVVVTSIFGCAPNVKSSLSGASELATPTYDVSFRLRSTKDISTIQDKDLKILSSVAERMKRFEVSDAQIAIADKKVLINGNIISLDEARNLRNPIMKTEEPETDCTDCPTGDGEPEDNGDRLVLEALTAPKHKMVTTKVINVSGLDLIRPR